MAGERCDDDVPQVDSTGVTAATLPGGKRPFGLFTDEGGLTFAFLDADEAEVRIAAASFPESRMARAYEPARSQGIELL